MATATEVNVDLFRIAETLRTLQESLQCVICLENLRDPMSTRCGHTFCKQCITRIVKEKNAVCPLCNTRVNRRGLVVNEKIGSLVRAVHALISAAQKDGEEMGYEDLLSIAKERKSTKEFCSPPGLSNNTAVTSESKTTSRRSVKVETWLMGVTPTSLTQESAGSPIVDVENTPTEDSDSEMVSVSQINPDQTTRSSINKPLSDLIEEDCDIDQGKAQKKTVKPKATTKALSVRKRGPSLNMKSKQGSLKGFFKSRPISSINTSNVMPIDVPEPVVVILDGEKENSSNLPPRSPGWSRVNKMKKDFHEPSKVLKTVNSKGDNSPLPIIEDPVSGDEHPCLSLSLDSPVLKKKAKMNEIVNDLELEIKSYEESVIPLQKNTNCKISQIDNTFPSKKALVQFFKLGPIVKTKQPRVPIYLKGPLEHFYSVDMTSMGYRLLVDAETQTSPEIMKTFIQSTSVDPTLSKCESTREASSPINSFRSPHNRRSAGASSDFDVDMDAETVLFSQPPHPIHHGNKRTVNPPLSFDNIPNDVEIMGNGNQDSNDDGLTQKPSISCQGGITIPQIANQTSPESKLSQDSTSIGYSPVNPTKCVKNLSEFETTSYVIPTVDLDITSSFIDDNSRKSKRVSSSSESSESDIGISNKLRKKRRKNKTQVLSDNEDSCQNELDISVVDTAKIMANIEAQLEDSERTPSPDWFREARNKSIDHLQETVYKPPIPDDPLAALLETSRNGVDSDEDSEFINPTPQKETSFKKKNISQSEDIVPSSQPPVEAPEPPVSVLPMSCDDSSKTNPSSLQSKETSSLEQTVEKDNAIEPITLVSPEPVTSSDTLGNLAAPVTPVFVCSSIPANLASKVEKLANIVGGKFSSKYTANTTHLIVRVDEGNRADKTLKYLCAVAAGKWVVSFSWVEKCLEAKQLISEEPYEALDTSGEPGPRRSREARLINKKLFKNFEFCCVGDFPDLSKPQLEELLVESGASIVSKPTEFSFQDRIIPITLVQYDDSKEQEYLSWLDRYSSPLVQHEWVLDSIGKFSVTSFSPMLLCDASDDVLSSMGIPPYLFEYVDSEQQSEDA